MTYQYRSLAQGEIRLLRFNTTGLDEPTRIELQTYPLTADLRYTALSYSWAADGEEPSPSMRGNKSTTQPRRIIVGDGECITLATTAALANALLHLRESDHQDDLLWIDQICINQDNEPEKAQQLVMMDEIYTRATRLIVWLGEQDNDTELAFTTLHETCQELEDKGQLKDMLKTDLSMAAMTDASGVLRIDRWLAVCRLLKRRWFSRLWIVQEICLPKTDDIEVACGRFRIQWLRLSFITTAMGRYKWTQHAMRLMQSGAEVQAKGIELGSSVTLVPPLNLLRLMHQKGKIDSMLALLWSHRTRGCTKDRDRIFAIRALCPEIDREAIVAEDYLLPLDQLFIKCTRELIARSGSLNILGTCLPQQQLLSLPSWVPDWSNSDAHRGMRLLTPVSDFMPEHRYSVLPDRKVSMRPVQLGMEGDAVLAVEGYHVQTISHVSKDRGEEEKYLFTTPFTMGRAADDFWAMAKTPTIAHDLDPWTIDTASVDVDTAALVSKFRRTLIVNRNQFGKREIEPYPALQGGNAYLSALRQSVSGRRFFVTAEGDMGLGPYEIQLGDHICLLPGADVPFVLRPHEIEQSTPRNEGATAYTLVGECYCHDLMGEVEVDDKGMTLGDPRPFNIW